MVGVVVEDDDVEVSVVGVSGVVVVFVVEASLRQGGRTLGVELSLFLENSHYHSIPSSQSLGTIGGEKRDKYTNCYLRGKTCRNKWFYWQLEVLPHFYVICQ